jgi:hypothetical protein
MSGHAGHAGREAAVRMESAVIGDKSAESERVTRDT